MGWSSEFYFVAVFAHIQKGSKFQLWIAGTALMSLLPVRFAALRIFLSV
jgi:hypothetical protein